MTFTGSIITEGARCFIPIPGNAWDELQSKGNIPVSVEIGENRFECKLIPKGNGAYYIPVKKAIAARLADSFDVLITRIDGLSRINSNSPYSKDKPIRKLDSM